MSTLICSIIVMYSTLDKEIYSDISLTSKLHEESQKIILALCENLHWGYEKNQQRIDRVAGGRTFIKPRKYWGTPIEQIDITDDINEKPPIKLMFLDKIYKNLKHHIQKKYEEWTVKYTVSFPATIAANDKFLVQEYIDDLYSVARIQVSEKMIEGRYPIMFNKYFTHLDSKVLLDMSDEQKEIIWRAHMDLFKDLMDVIGSMIQGGELKVTIKNEEGQDITYYALMDLGFDRTTNIWFEKFVSGNIVQFHIPDVIKIDTREWNNKHG